MAKKESKRISWLDVENVDCIHLANYGLHASTISKATGLSRNQIYYRARQMGVKLRDYRDGRGPVANLLVRKFTVKNITKKDSQEITNAYAPIIQKKLQQKKNEKT